jgi:hypothetical protein
MDPSAPGGPNNGHALTKGKALSNAMRLGKRSLAGIAAGALALGMLTIASAPAATAANTIKPKATNSVSGTVSPVRVSLTGTTLDSVPYAQISWTSSATLAGTETAIVALTSAPSPVAQVGIVTAALRGNAATYSSNVFSNATDTALLNQPTDVGGGINVGSGTTGRVGIAANEPGTYTGTVTVQPVGGDVDVVSFSFTTTGKATSMTLTPASASTSISGNANLTVTLKDAAGNNTQPLAVDSVTMAATSGTAAAVTTTGNGTTSLFDGVAVSAYTAPATAGSYTVTATPGGTLPTGGVTTQSATVVVSGSISDSALTAISVSTPSDAVNTGTQPVRAAAVPVGTSAVTVTVTGAASTTYRLAAFASNLTGTINGTTAGTTLATAATFVDVKTSSSGTGTAAFTLAGNLLALNGAITINQVQANNTTQVGSVAMVVTQTAPAVGTDTIFLSPTGSIVQALGTSTPVVVTVTDQFEQPVANATVRAFRTSTTGTLLGSAVTNASGEATVTVSGASGITAGTTETYRFTATPPAGSATTSDESLVVTYTASGAVTSMSVTVAGGATTPILNTTTSISTRPYINVPYTGIVTGAASGVYTVATGAGTAAGNYVTFSAAPSPANMVTVTVPTGVKVSTSVPGATTLWSAGSQSVTVASSTNVYVWATKTGTHDITFTSGAITTTAKIEVATPAAAAYNIAVSPSSRTIDAGAFSTVELTVSDVFGNPVPAVAATAASAGAVAATATGEVLLGGLNSTAVLGTGATGKSTVTLIAGRQGTGQVTFGPSGGVANAAAAWQTGYVKPVGAPDPVTAAVVSVVITDTPDKSITISGTRGTVSGKSGIIVDGTTDGIENGKTVTPFIRFPGETEFTAGSARPEISADGFTWERKTGKRVTVYVELSDDASIRSNRVTIQAS